MSRSDHSACHRDNTDGFLFAGGKTKSQGTGSIINDDGVAAPLLLFSQASYSVQEDLTVAMISVTRSGDTSGTTYG